MRLLKIDFKTDLVLQSHKVNHAAAHGKVIDITDRQHRAFLQRGQDLLQAPTLRSTDEQKLTSPCLFDTDQGANEDLSIFNIFSVQALQRGVKGVLAKNADREGGLVGGKGRNRPVDKLGKVVEESAFDRILTGGAGFAGKGQGEGCENDDAKDGQAKSLKKRERYALQMVLLFRLGPSRIFV